jgi:polyphosphate kinase
MTKTKPASPSRFFGRDESWLRFNRRVLEEAENDANPLLERVKFLAITASNLDEFVEIRVAGMLQRIEDGYNEAGADGFTLEETLDALTRQMHAYVEEQYCCWKQQLVPALREHGIRVLGWDEMDEAAQETANAFYQREVDPLLTPITIDPAHPFPRVLNKALCLALLLHSKRKATSEPVLGVVTVPRALPRLVQLPSTGGTIDYIFLHDLIERNAAAMYRGYEILSKAAFRVTRNSNLYFQEEESRNLLETVRSELHNRRKGDAVRLEIERDADNEIVERLRVNFELDETQVYRTDGPVNLSRLMHLYSDTPRPDLKYPPFTARELRLHRKSADLFDELRQRDVLLHHPYDSYDGVVEFIEAAAEDPDVVSIKQTLYRTSSDSPIFRALTEAAATKEVTVVVELTARFDEASNIRWARALEDAGVQVFHGIVGLKTHCKLALLVRRDPDGEIRRYAHLGTGNYNPDTARFYTDLSLLTADAEITASVHNVFNYLTAHSEADDYAPLLVAPLTLAENFMRLIHRETSHARAGRPARIIAKMNSLLERSMIEALYEASNAGVQIELIVRGICALRPGVKGMSENIRVRSIVGRFLEHSRIFYFENGGAAEIYCGSADWMPRNLFERCETIFPVRDAQLKTRIREEILAACLADTVKARYLHSDGEYRPVNTASSAKDAPVFSSQDFLMRVAEGKANVRQIPAAVMISLEDVQPGTEPPSAPRAKKKSPVKRNSHRSNRKADDGAKVPLIPSRTSTTDAGGLADDEELDPAESTLR